MVQMDFIAANNVGIVRLCGQNKAHRAVIFAPTVLFSGEYRLTIVIMPTAEPQSL